MSGSYSVERKSWAVKGTQFDLDSKYTVNKEIGFGAYGVVVSGVNSETQEKIAIKKCPNVFNDLVDGKRILREIKILSHMNHENLLGIKDILRPPSYDTYKDVYIISELMDTDLHRVVSSRQKLTDEHCQFFTYQLVRGLKYIHSANIVHRDLKPSNLLVNANCDLKICDFGLARGVYEDVTPMTTYVVTRWYRAPELLLSCKAYSKSIDIWSIGCIVAEILNRKPLFRGDNHVQQMAMYLNSLGCPTDSDLASMQAEEGFKYFRQQGFKGEKKPLEKLMPTASKQAIDFVQQCFTYDPAKRPSCEDLLAHPYLAALHDPTAEPSAPSAYSWEWDDVDVTEEELRALFWKEMVRYHPDN